MENIPQLRNIIATSEALGPLLLEKKSEERKAICLLDSYVLVQVEDAF